MIQFFYSVSQKINTHYFQTSSLHPYSFLYQIISLIILYFSLKVSICAFDVKKIFFLFLLHGISTAFPDVHQVRNGISAALLITILRGVSESPRFFVFTQKIIHFKMIQYIQLNKEAKKNLKRLRLRGEVKEVPEICSAYSPYGQTRGLFCATGRAPARASEEKWLPNPERYTNSPPSIGFSMIHRTNTKKEKE